MNRNTLIAHTDSEKVFIALTKMEYDSKETEYTVTVMTNPSYGSDYEDYTMICKSFHKAWEAFKDEYTKHNEILELHIDSFEETERAAIAYGNGTIIELKDAYECGWMIELQTVYSFKDKDGEYRNTSYDEYSHIADAIAEIKKKANEYEIPNVYIDPYYADDQTVAEIDRKHDEYIRQEMYRDACNLEWYCNDSSLMRRYERTYGEE